MKETSGACTTQGNRYTQDNSACFLKNPSYNIKLSCERLFYLVFFLFGFCLKCSEFFHLSYQLRRPPGPHGPPMYAHRMAMDPRFTYPAHIPRHGDPNMNRLPHNYNIQVNKSYYTFIVLLYKITSPNLIITLVKT